MEFILTGAPSNWPKIDKGLAEYFFEQATKFGDEKVFQIDADTGKQETYQDVKRRSTRVALYLQKIGIQAKDIVMLCCKNNLDNVIPAFAAQYLGAITASIDPKQTVSEVKYSINLIEPKVVFVEENSLNLLEKTLEGTKEKPHIITIGSSNGRYPNMYDIELQGHEEEHFKPVKQKLSDIAAIIFSSGTTSTPKGICISNCGIMNTAGQLLQINNIKPGIFVHLASLYWISSWFYTAVCVSTASTKLIAPEIKAEKWFQLVDKYKVTNLFTSSTYTYELTSLDEEIIKKYDTSSLYSILIGGSTIDPKQILKMRKYFPHSNVALGYGGSEINYVACHDYSNQKAVQEKISSSGTVLPDVQIKFVDVESHKPVGPEHEGEIYVKSNFLMSGYYKYSKPDIYDEDGFLKTGDIGYYDQEGYIYVTDRLSEMFKYKTYQISPTLLENVLLEHPAVREAVVFGVPHPVDRNHPAACVILKPDTTVTEKQLEDFFNSKVADSSQIRAGIMILKSIPKTPTGKYQRRMVKELFIKLKKEKV